MLTHKNIEAQIESLVEAWEWASLPAAAATAAAASNRLRSAHKDSTHAPGNNFAATSLRRWCCSVGGDALAAAATAAVAAAAAVAAQAPTDRLIHVLPLHHMHGPVHDSFLGPLVPVALL